MSTARTAARWLHTLCPRPSAQVRFLCFPHAGGNAAFFRSWSERLPDQVEVSAVQYPGRMDRLDEPVIQDAAVLADLVCQAVLATDQHRPVAAFGHSMGATVAHEVLLRVQRERPDAVRHLMVSGRPGPSRIRRTTWHLASDTALWEQVARLGGTPDEAVTSPELRGMLLPALRGDYRLAETHRPATGAGLSCPVTAFNGDQDTEVDQVGARAWAETTTGPFRSYIFPGGHFYLRDQETDVLAQVARLLGFRSSYHHQWPSTP